MNLNPFTYGVLAMIPQESWDRGITFVCLAALALWTYKREKSREEYILKDKEDFVNLTQEKVALLKDENKRLLDSNEELLQLVLKQESKDK